MHDLFTKIQESLSFSLSHLEDIPLNSSDHGFELPSYSYKLHKQSFVTNCLFKYFK